MTAHVYTCINHSLSLSLCGHKIVVINCYLVSFFIKLKLDWYIIILYVCVCVVAGSLQKGHVVFCKIYYLPALSK